MMSVPLSRSPQQLKADLMHHFDSQLNELVESLTDQSHRPGSSSLSGSSQPAPDTDRTELSELFEVNHIRTIYHMFIALLILFILSTLVVDFIDEGRLVLDFDLLVFAFGQFPLVVVSWLCMFVSALVVPFALLRWWAGVCSSSHHRTIYTLLAMTLLLLYQSLGLGFLPTYIVLKNSLPPASCFILILEQVLGCLFYAYYVLVRLCIPQFRSVSMQLFNLRVMVLCVFNSILPGALILFLAFFAILHCWLNAFAEMLRFGDRMFYRKRFRAMAMFVVFTVSAVVHEYVLAVCFGFFYPVLFCLFMCFGMMFNFILHDRRTGPVWNIIVWTALFLGLAVLLCLYSQEWYAQKYCPLQEPSFLDLLKPRSWTCYIQTGHAARDS
ncbi:hypothetical protein QTP86_013462 [Hemibagrus guttatus]|nr:hypothetical protein QTP86_013462 [Hemibagrus guttatus]